MNYLIVQNGIISNIIIADETFSDDIGALPYYDGAEIGKEYKPPKPSPTAEQDILDLLIDQEIRLKKLEMGVS